VLAGQAPFGLASAWRGFQPMYWRMIERGL